MKKFVIKISCTVMALCSAAAFSACNSQESSSQAETKPTEIQTTAVPTTAPMTKEADLTKLHALSGDGDVFTGYWKITDGEGSQLKSVVYEFDGKGKGYFYMGSMGTNGTYEIKTENSQEVFSAPFIFGNENYTFKFSDDKKSVVLTGVSGKATSTMKRVENFYCIPAPSDSAKIDDNLLGAWKDDAGEYLYFGKDGIMYRSQSGIAFYFISYSAENGQVTETYSVGDEVTDTYSYKLNGETLTYNGFEYKRISAAELE